MSRSRRVGTALLTSALAAAVMAALSAERSPLAAVGWLVFFASLQYPAVFPEHADVCRRFLRRRAAPH
jgi:hypothetical protein